MFIWMFSGCSKLLKQQSTGKDVVTLGHIIPTSANQSLFLVLNAVYLAEEKQIPIS
jgi:hypothetical protein